MENHGEIVGRALLPQRPILPSRMFRPRRGGAAAPPYLEIFGGDDQSLDEAREDSRPTTTAHFHSSLHTICRRYKNCHTTCMNNRWLLILCIATTVFAAYSEAVHRETGHNNPEDRPDWRGTPMSDWTEPASGDSQPASSAAPAARGIVIPAAQQP